MKTILEFDYKDYIEGGSVGRRPSVRAIIIRDGKLAMVYSQKYDYYTFSGGGVDEGESHEHALIREIAEELGLEVIPESIKEYGLVVRKEKGMFEDLFIQENYFYTCEVGDSVVAQKLEGYEADERFTLCWVDPMEAIEVNSKPEHGEATETSWAKHLFERETIIIKRLIDEGLL